VPALVGLGCLTSVHRYRAIVKEVGTPPPPGEMRGLSSLKDPAKGGVCRQRRTPHARGGGCC
jgi:hypothetical protein